MIRQEDIERLATEYGEDIKKELGITELDDVSGYVSQAKAILKWLDQKDYVIVSNEKIQKEWNYILCLVRNANRGRYKTHYDIEKLFDNLFYKAIFDHPYADNQQKSES